MISIGEIKKFFSDNYFRKIIAVIAALVTLAMLFSFANIALSFLSRKSGYSRVPDVVGLDIEKAERKFAKSDLKLLVSGRTMGGSEGEGRVSYQHIPLGSYCPNYSFVPVSVDVGIQIEKNDDSIPNLLYICEQEASEYIDKYNITIRREPCCWAVDGLIISQIQLGEETTLIVSDNPMQTLNGSKGQKAADVIKEAENNNIACDVFYVRSESNDRGKIISDKTGSNPTESKYLPPQLSVGCKKSVGTIGLWLSDENINMYIGDRCRLIAKEISFLNAAQNTEIIWESSNPDAAVVDSCGNVFAVNTGSATITAYAKNGKIAKSCNVTVGQRLTGLHLNVPKSKQEVALNTEYLYDEIIATAVYSGGITRNVTDKCRFSKVDTSSMGTVDMHISYSEGERLLDAAYTVNVCEDYSRMSKQYIEIGVNCREKLAVETNVHGEISFESSNVDICTVDETGELTGVTPGKCSITVYCGKNAIGICSIVVKKTFFLTFDDGPCYLTPQILDILEENDVKATFFVVGKPDESYRYKKITDSGHTLGLHTYSHDFPTCYDSEEAFFNDLYKLNDLLKQSGVDPVKLFRFPGGSTNDWCNQKFMDKLKARAKDEGFVYCDWNAQDGRMIDKDYVVMLMHETINDTRILPQVIDYYKKSGYIFETISDDTYMIQFDS